MAALNILHTEEPLPVLGEEFIKGCQVGMTNVRQGAEFVLEELRRARIETGQLAGERELAVRNLGSRNGSARRIVGE